MSETISRYTLVHRPGQTQPELVACEKSDYNAMCYSRDVSVIEAKCAELEAMNAELLEALENLVLQIDDVNWGIKSYETVALKAARAAVAKAKGEQL